MLACALAAAPLTTACLTDSGADDASDKDPGGGKEDGWDWGGAPERFGVTLERRLDQLPTTGRAAVAPWSETYWPTAEDSFNVRWAGAGTLSPLEKYDQAYNGWTPPPGFAQLRPMTAANCASGQWDKAYYAALGPAAKYWSREKGLGRVMNGLDDDGDGRVDECDDLDGIEDWWGSCHAWTPAAILEREPLEPVTINGVRFETSDIKALLISLYDESTQIAIGDRCSLANPPRDATGRIIDAACRNTNAGTFHLLLANLLGVQARAFGEDRVTDLQVWNQPLIGYRLPVSREITAAQANALLGVAGDAYPYNPAAKRFAEVAADVDYVVEAYPSTRPSSPHIDDYVRTDHYRYVLELDQAGAIIGGEWIAARSGGTYAQNDRPDYLWLPIGPGRNPNPSTDPSKVRELLRLARPDTRNLAVDTFTNATGGPIPDFPYGPLASTITVPKTEVVTGVVVRAEVLHSWSYDLVITLRHDGREQVLFNRNPQGTSTDFTATWSASDFVGAQAAGDWTLLVKDRDGRNVGRLARWSLELTGQGEIVTPPPPPAEPVTIASVGDPIAIPDNAPAGIASTIDVPSEMIAGRVSVHVDITHPYRGDLIVSLEHGGVTQTLANRAGSSADDLIADLDATVFAGALAAGPWVLRVSDRARADVGRLNGWSLTLAP